MSLKDLKDATHKCSIPVSPHHVFSPLHAAALTSDHPLDSIKDFINTQSLEERRHERDIL